MYRKLYEVVEFGTGKPQETKSKYSFYVLVGMLTRIRGVGGEQKGKPSGQVWGAQATSSGGLLPPALPHPLHCLPAPLLPSHSLGSLCLIDGSGCECSNFSVTKSPKPPFSPIAMEEMCLLTSSLLLSRDLTPLVFCILTFFFLRSFQSLLKHSILLI